ncbi:DUF1893 domain-containing protein [Tissierella creatinophila]|uniref:DUF1893 domain-containing protein n=1 Tax=Tissierella creatinophila DSM 6911 TaxID=1123403 RepID=A0A1U7M8W1_TISCR|nr:DUF1893 domain-containing protein [Tissierella creatinophila]OLS03649.1 hypothetical protein TICRE_03450 [Tissierella creatinophila DSM 6911]
MKDIEIAKELLQKEDYTLVVVKSGEILFTSRDKGIKPMYRLVKDMKEISIGASIADKVIGRGAALLSGYLRVKEVYGEVMSKEAVEVLEKDSIDYSFLTLCDYIKNRDRTGLCPIESLSLNKTDPIIFIEEVEEFFKSK